MRRQIDFDGVDLLSSQERIEADPVTLCVGLGIISQDGLVLPADELEEVAQINFSNSAQARQCLVSSSRLYR